MLAVTAASGGRSRRVSRSRCIRSRRWMRQADMFCSCCNLSTSFPASGFFAEGLTDTVPDVASALQRRALVSAGDINAANVVMVCIDGRIRKRNGVVVEPSEGVIRKEGQEALARLRNPAKRSPSVGVSHSW